MGRKKPVEIDDDEYGVPDGGAAVAEDTAPVIADVEKENRPAAASRKGKKVSGGGAGAPGGKKYTVNPAADEAAAPEKLPGDEEEAIVFSGKKKSSKSKKGRAGGGFSDLNALDEEEDDGREEHPRPEPDVEHDPPIQKFSEPKAKSRFEAINYTEDLEDESGNAEAEEGMFSKNTKKKKKKKGGKAEKEEEDTLFDHKEEKELTLPLAVSSSAHDELKEDVEDESGNAEALEEEGMFNKNMKKKKKKKGGKAEKDEEDTFHDHKEEKELPLPPAVTSSTHDESKEDVEDESGNAEALEEEGMFNKNMKKKKKKKGGKAEKDEEDALHDHTEEKELYLPPALTSAQDEPKEDVEDVNDNTEALEEEGMFNKSMKKKKKKGGKVEMEEEETLHYHKEEKEKLSLHPVPTSLAQDETKEEDGTKQQQKKKKKNKSGRTAQEEENLDKILAELGEGPVPSSEPVAALTQPEVDEPEEKENEDGGDAVESAAARKKKKKKEKEKEKKAAASAAAAAPAEEVAKEDKKEDPKGKKAIDNKKLPKHVREMQEKLARRKELEEQQKREEEERIRKEEEERRLQEQLEMEAEERKRLKKEREKEKKLQKKLEGKPFTSKQKEDARRLDDKRRQFAGETSGIGVSVEETGKKKRPVYGNKKAKQAHKADESEKVEESQQEEMEQAEDYAVAETESQFQFGDEEATEDKHEIEEAQALEEDEDDDEWDAKSWDDVDVKLNTNAFADEDAEETKPVGRKISPSIDSQANSPVLVQPAVKKVVAPSVHAKTGEVEGKVNGAVIENAKGKKEAGRSTESKESQDAPKKSGSDLRSPICCILGHVDTGKTKLLDCIRRTNVQEGEAGGITQQIGATYFPAENIRERTKELKADATLKVPGLLVIDTPGHESFTNLRSRGSSLCDIAILVVDIMHGLERQTIESLNLLKSRNTEFIIALNKVDRLYGWKTSPNAPMIKSIKQQSKDVRNEYERRVNDVITQFKEQGLNTALYYKNREMGETYNIVPTSAITGEGIPDLLLLVIQWAQKTMEDKLTYVDKVEGTVLEVKVIEGLGTTIDVVLVNGVLHEGDQIVVCGMQGPIDTHIRALLTPHPMKELRVKGAYQHHKEIKAAQGVKISAQDLELAVAGTPLYVVGPDDNIIDIKEAAMEDMKRVMNRIDRSGEGVYVQASTLGSLEALTEYLKSPDVEIPFFDFSIGPVHKKDVIKASVMVEKKREYAAILAFDVKVMPEAREYAAATGVTIFEADIIYHLFDQFKGYIDNLREEKKKESADEAVFPCVLKIMPNCIFNKKDPIVLGVSVLEGIVKVGTPICIPSRDFIDIGRIQSIEINHKQVDEARKGPPVAIKIVGTNPEEQQKMYGRHFEIDDELVSRLSRKSIDILKANYRDELSTEEWKLVVRLKQKLKIP